MQTWTLTLGGGAIVAVAVVAAVALRPLSEIESATSAAGVDAVQEVAVAPADEGSVEVSVSTEEAGATSEELVVAVAEDAAVATDEDAAVTAPERNEAAKPEDDQTAQPQVAAASAAPETSDTPQDEVAGQVGPIAPSPLDFRFEPDGFVMVGGKADAAFPLAVTVDGAEVERIEVNADGGFLYVGALGRSDSPRILRIVSDPEGAARVAERTYVLAANPAPVIDVAEAEPAPMADPETPDVIAEAQPDAAVEEEPAAPAILAVTDDGVEVVQPPIAADAPPQVMSTVALDTITYDPDGEVVLRGRAMGEGFVQVYVDNAPVSRLPVDAEGRWRGDLPDVDTGVYTLRIDEVDAEGAVVSRIETPFLREDPADVAEAMADDVDDPTFTVATRTVQPGATLWAIAEERYGSGVLFVNVFEANRDRIRDPDLIYPGQVFVLPEDDS